MCENSPIRYNLKADVGAYLAAMAEAHAATERDADGGD